MKLYIDIKEMELEDGIIHDIVNKIRNIEFFGYDKIIELPDDDLFIQTAMKVEYKKDEDGIDTDEITDVFFITKEQDSWWSFPIYEIINGQIVSFDYTQYEYFLNTNRRNDLADKISSNYGASSEIKTLRKTLKYVMDALNIEYPESFKKYNLKVEKIIAKNPK